MNGLFTLVERPTIKESNLQIVIWNITNLIWFSLIKQNQMPQIACILNLGLKAKQLQIRLETAEAYSNLSDTNDEQTLIIMTEGDTITTLLN